MESQNETTFEAALSLIKSGKKAARRGWKNVTFIFLVQGSEFEVNRAPLNQFFSVGTKVKYNPHIDVVGTDGSIGVWTPTNFDVLSEDWYEVTE